MLSHTVPLTTSQAGALRAVLEGRGFEFVSREHALFAARSNQVQVTVYRKGPKALIQGKGTRDFVEFILEPEVLGEARLGYEEILDPAAFEPHFGIDESGKGDYFGPLVIAGVYTDAAVGRKLMDAGVMDSKRVGSSAAIRRLAAVIRRTPGCHAELVAIGPERYNEMYRSFRNLNRLLAWGHSRVIAKLAAAVPSCPRALSDQFAHPAVLQRALREQRLDIRLEQRVKGEEDIAVAAASILARERFVDWMEKTSAACGVKLPLGGGRGVAEAGRLLIGKLGPEALGKVAKLHFRNTREILPGAADGP